MSLGLRQKYDGQWRERLTSKEANDFFTYDRNRVVLQLLKRRETLLDLASGNSTVGSYAQSRFECDVVALDISLVALGRALRNDVKSVAASAEDSLPFKDATFDTVFWGDNIEHIFFPERTLRQIHRVLKPNGRVIISTPNQAYWYYRLFTFVTGRVAKTEGANNPPWGWTHIRFFTKGILKRLLQETGFRMVRCVGSPSSVVDKPFVRLLPSLFTRVLVVEAVRIEPNRI